MRILSKLLNTAYRALLSPEHGSGFVVSFPDVPEALTSGETETEALRAARDCLIAALGGYIEARRPVPKAAARRGEPIYLPSLVVAKLALYERMRREGLTAVALGERLGLSEGAVRRLLDLDHRSHIGNVESALAVLGQRLLLEVAQRERPDARDLAINAEPWMRSSTALD
jgi:antitoxin HicB